MAQTIKDLILQLSDTGDVKYCVPAKVVAVDKDLNTVDVDPLDGSAELVEVRLQAQQGSGVVYYPVVGSTVIVSFLSKDDAYVSMFSDIEQLTIANAQTTLKKILKDFSKAVQSLKLTTPQGPTTGVINLPDFTQVDSLIDALFAQ